MWADAHNPLSGSLPPHKNFFFLVLGRGTAHQCLAGYFSFQAFFPLVFLRNGPLPGCPSPSSWTVPKVEPFLWPFPCKLFTSNRRMHAMDRPPFSSSSSFKKPIADNCFEGDRPCFLDFFASLVVPCWGWCCKPGMAFLVAHTSQVLLNEGVTGLEPLGCICFLAVSSRFVLGGVHLFARFKPLRHSKPRRCLGPPSFSLLSPSPVFVPKWFVFRNKPLSCAGPCLDVQGLIVLPFVCFPPSGDQIAG